MKQRIISNTILIFVLLSLCYYRCPTDAPDPVFPPEMDLAIPAYWQLYPMWCGHACVEMWAHYKGNIFATQETIAWDPSCCDSASPWQGMFLYQVIRAVNKYAGPAAGDYTFIEDDNSLNMIFSRITDSLHYGHPSILITLNLDTADKHALIVKGYDSLENSVEVPNIENIRFIDPWDALSKQVTLSEMKSGVYWPTCDYMTEADRVSDMRTCGYIYILGLGDRTFSEIDLDASTGYSEYLKRCGTYYGGPEIYIPEGSTFLRTRYPQGSEVLGKGNIEEIKWESNGLSGGVRLELFKDGVSWGTIAESLPILNGSYNWTVGNCLTGIAPTGQGYRVKVSKIDDSYDDFSNLEFSIAGMTLNRPNGGERWPQESSEEITWDSSCFSGNVQLRLVKITTGTEYMVAESTENDGSFSWTVGLCSHIDSGTLNLPSGLAIPDENYKVKVISVDYPDIFDESDQKFAITTPPTITVASPNGGEKWLLGSTRDITWEAVEVNGLLTVSLWKESTWIGDIARDIDPATATLSWNSGSLEDGSTAKGGSGYRVKIADSCESVSGISEAPFSLSSLQLSSPCGGET